MPPLIRRLLALLAPRLPSCLPLCGPPGEGALARQLRQRRDRTRLAGLDDRLLRDMGLRREVSAAGLDFVPLSSADPVAAARPASSSDHSRAARETGMSAMSSHRHGAIDWP